MSQMAVSKESFTNSEMGTQKVSLTTKLLTSLHHQSQVQWNFTSRVVQLSMKTKAAVTTSILKKMTKMPGFALISKSEK